MIVLVRHGETDWNLAGRLQGRTEVPLNDTGRLQAAATTELLAAAAQDLGLDSWAGIYSSPLGRAVETARIIGSSLGFDEPRIHPKLLERDFGPAEGLLVTEAQVRWPNLEVPGGETVEALAQRASNAFDRLLTEASGSIAVAHGALLRIGLSHFCGTQVPRILNGEAWLLTREGATSTPTLTSLGTGIPSR